MTIPAPLAGKLNDLAKKTKRTRTVIVREAIEEYIDRCCRRQLEDEMARYVERMAPASGEFTRETSSHVADLLLRETEW